MSEEVVRVETGVTGRERLKALRLRLKEVEKNIRLEFNASIRAALEPLKTDIRQSALSSLPKRGGLAAKVADSKFSIRARPETVIFQTKNPYEIKRIDEGSVRHPVFGNRKAWVTEKVTPGFWSKPIITAGPVIQAAIVTVIDDTIREIER